MSPGSVAASPCSGRVGGGGFRHDRPRTAPHLGPVGEPFDLGMIVYPDDATVARDHPVRLVVSDTLERRSPRRGDDPRRVFGMQESLPQLRVGEPLIGRSCRARLRRRVLDETRMSPNEPRDAARSADRRSGTRFCRGIALLPGARRGGGLGRRPTNGSLTRSCGNDSCIPRTRHGSSPRRGGPRSRVSGTTRRTG